MPLYQKIPDFVDGKYCIIANNRIRVQLIHVALGSLSFSTITYSVRYNVEKMVYASIIQGTIQ